MPKNMAVTCVGIKKVERHERGFLKMTKCVKNNFIDLACVETSKANAQALVCTLAFYACILFAAVVLSIGIALPVLCLTVQTAWVSMGLEAAAVGLVYLAWWIRKNAM